MKFFICLVMFSILFWGCAEDPDPFSRKLHFSSRQEFNELYLPLQRKHGGVKKWEPVNDADCSGGKNFQLADGFQVIFCPAGGDQDLFK